MSKQNESPVESEAQATPPAEAVEAATTATEAAEAAVETTAETAAETASEAEATEKQALETVETAGAAIFERVARVQREIAGFVSERLRQDIEAQQELLRCRSLGELRDVQARYFRTAVDQYSQGASRLLRIGAVTADRPFERVE